MRGGMRRLADGKDGWRAVWRLARSEWRQAGRQLKTLIACLVIGVVTIGGVESVKDNLERGIAENGRRLLAGDLMISRLQQPLPRDLRQLLARYGTVQESVRLTTNIRAVGKPAAPALALLRAVDEHYPLYGGLRLDPPRTLAQALAEGSEGPGIILAPELAARLGVRLGDRVQVGRAVFVVRALLGDEPDRLATGMRLGPTAMIARKAAVRTGLLAFGSLATYSYRLRLAPGGPTPAQLRDQLLARFPDAHLRIVTADRAAPGLRRFLDRFGHFLLLVSLTALLLGGVGVANGVRAYLARREEAIATIKLMGGGRRTVFAGYGLVLGGIVAAAMLAGLVLAAAVPFGVKAVLAEILPVPYRPRIAWAALGHAAFAGSMIATAFALVPLRRAAALPAGRLWRWHVSRERWRDPKGRWASGILVLVLAAVTIWRAPEPRFAAIFVAASALAIALLWGLAAMMPWALRHLVRQPKGAWKIALAHLARPGGRSASIMLSLGLGLALFATLALVESNLQGGMRRDLGERAPNFFFLDIPKQERQRFVELARRFADGRTALRLVPALRGRIVALAGRLADPQAVAPEVRWVLRGDRGITFARALPPGNVVVAGRWWPADYAGPPLVSVSAEEARGLGLNVGDTLTVSVLGREITATVASLRRLSWRSAGFNFVLVFDPATFAAAPFTYMASLRTPDLASEEAAYRAITTAFPQVTAVRVRDVLQTVENLLAQMAAAIRLTALLTVLAGVVVLIGAIAAEERLRQHEAAVLKLLGATRGDVLRAFLLELVLIGVLAAALALAVSGLAARFVVVEALQLTFSWQMPVALATLAASLAMALVFGGAIGWRTLTRRPASLLREA
ncbi:MAG: FtsX-like permease family protein [Alphaproteobacteria bacterium]|nr:MAG: FtsX-like permease family protein [Alphaproteobacteria bacterium]